MGSEHTPGPWSFCRIGARTGPVRMTNKTFVIHPVAGPRFAYLPEGRDDIQEANARLIAAAPDLLAALKAAEVMLRGCRVFVPKTDVLDATLADVLNAIAKAEGGAA